MLPREFLIPQYTCIKFTWLQYLVSLENFSQGTVTIASNSGTVLTNKTGLYTLQQTRTPRTLTQCLSSHVDCLGIIAKNVNVTLLILNGKCLFKCQTLKGEIFQNYLTVTKILLSHPLSKAVLGFNILAILIHCALELLEPLSITLLLVNIVWGFSLGKNSCVHVVYTLLNLDDISCMNARDSTIIGTPEGILQLIFHYSLNLTVMLSLLDKVLLHCLVVSINCFIIYY